MLQIMLFVFTSLNLQYSSFILMMVVAHIETTATSKTT
jgi:hypothetical protein